jgi:acyl carrier protein
MDSFYEKIADILEVDAIQEGDVLADFPEWDSLSVLSVIAMVGSDYGVVLTASDLRALTTAASLRDLVAARSGR